MKKLIYLLILSLVLANPSFAQQERIYSIKSFEKGLNSHVSSWNLQDNQASQVRNVRFNRAYSSVSKRKTMQEYGDVGSTAITSLHRYYGSDGTQSLLATTSTVLMGDGDTGTFANLRTNDLTDGIRWTWVTYQDNAIGMNGTDLPIKYDGSTDITANTTGHRTAGYLVAELGAPYAELLTGANLEASKWYIYRMAWYDGTTYTYSTARSNPIQAGSSVQDITLTNIPLGPSGTTTRYLFRTDGKASAAAALALDSTAYKLAITIADNSTLTTPDAIADGSLTTVLSTWITDNSAVDATVPIGKYCVIHQERLFVAGNSTDKSDLFWSDEYNPDYFTVIDLEKIRPDDGDSITFIKNLLGILTVGKENSIQKFYTSPTSETDWYVSDPFTFIGCPAPHSVANTPVGLVYLGRRGIYRFTGQSSELISDAVTVDIDDILETEFDDVFGYYWKSEYNMAYTSQAAGGVSNNRVLIYDIIRDAYTMDFKNINCFEAFDSGTDFGVLYSGDSTTGGLVYAHEGSTVLFSVQYKSDLDAGTFDDTRSQGTEEDPELELAWDCTIDGWLAEIQVNEAGVTNINGINLSTTYADSIIDRPDTDGTWATADSLVNATALDKIYWTENLKTSGDIVWDLKTGATAGAGTYGSDYTIATGSDISAESANTYITLRAQLSTTDITESPILYEDSNFILKMEYSKTGSSTESDFTSTWQGGWEDFGVEGYKKRLKRIKVYYVGDTGTLTVRFKNEEGDIDTSFDINLSQDPYYIDPDTDNFYSGSTIDKIFTYYPTSNEDGSAPTGQHWQFSLSELGANDWSVNRIETLYEANQIYD